MVSRSRTNRSSSRHHGRGRVVDIDPRCHTAATGHRQKTLAKQCQHVFGTCARSVEPSEASEHTFDQTPFRRLQHDSLFGERGVDDLRDVWIGLANRNGLVFGEWSLAEIAGTVNEEEGFGYIALGAGSDGGV